MNYHMKMKIFVKSFGSFVLHSKTQFNQTRLRLLYRYGNLNKMKTYRIMNVCFLFHLDIFNNNGIVQYGFEQVWKICGISSNMCVCVLWKWIICGRKVSYRTICNACGKCFDGLVIVLMLYIRVDLWLRT